jgi:metal-responsive CopG/Arc/MetJ family transcriptional regulator
VRAVKILLGDDLLAELDDTYEVRLWGRSEVLRRLARDFLHRYREREMTVTPSSGNVFADLGFAEPEEELAKAQRARRRVFARKGGI